MIETLKKAEEIISDFPSVKVGLDDFYGRQTSLNMIKEALTINQGKESVPCTCGCKTFTHRHSNWIECTNCRKIKVL